MDKIGNIEIRVTGEMGKLKVSPDNYDIRDIISILQNVEDALYPSNKKDRPIIAYDIEEGSVKHIFKTALQAVIGFDAIIGQVAKTNSIDFLELKTAQAIENIQELSYKNNFDFEIKTSVSSKNYLVITPATKFFRTQNIWVDAELYFYGILTNAGGKNKANIHIDTKEYGSLTIETPKEFLEVQENNVLYKKYGVRSIGKQNIETGEIDKSTLKLIELIDYSPKFDEDYLNNLISKAKSSWKNININDWLTNIRGDYDS